MSTKTLITGATSGIGIHTAVKLAEAGHDVTGLVRDIDKGRKLQKEGELPEGMDFIECDLADLKSVRKCADQVREKFDQIDVLINNAGGVFTKQDETADGLEMTFAVNHLGHFALTLSIMDKLVAGGARIINVSSEAHKSGKLDFEQLAKPEKYGSWKAYGDGKLCNIYFTKELVRRYGEKGMTSYSLHPGVVRTNFFNPFKGVLGFLIKMFGFLMISPASGAQTSVYLATEEGLEGHSGGYFKKSKPARTSKVAQDREAAEKLWDYSEEILQEKGYKTGI